MKSGSREIYTVITYKTNVETREKQRRFPFFQFHFGDSIDEIIFLLQRKISRFHDRVLTLIIEMAILVIYVILDHPMG